MRKIIEYLERIGQFGVTRPLVLLVTLWLTYDAYQWAAAFAEVSQRSGAEVTMIIAAVIAPVSVLQGYVFKQFITSCQR